MYAKNGNCLASEILRFDPAGLIVDLNIITTD